MLIGIAALNLALIGSLAWWMSRKLELTEKKIFWPAIVVKMCAGIALGLVYHYYYRVGDTLCFFDDAVRLNNLAGADFSGYVSALMSGMPPIELCNYEPRAFFFTALVSVVNFLSGRNYWLSSLWFSMFSFVGVWYFVRQFQAMLPAFRQAAIIGFLFFPSVVFWSSGIIKESIGFGALCLLTGAFCKVMIGNRLSWYEYPVVLMALWLLVSLKYYWAAVFFPSAVTTLIVHWVIEKRVSRTVPLVGCWVVIFAFLCWMATLTHPNFYLERFLGVIRQNHEEFVAISAPDNLIHFPAVVTGWRDVVINSPLALVSGLFRPFLFEAGSLTGIVSSIENLVILGLVVLRVWRPGRVTGLQRILLLSVLSYTTLLCIFLAMSTPNFGTLSRYRIGFLPFFILIVLHDNPLLRRLRRTATS